MANKKRCGFLAVPTVVFLFIWLLIFLDLNGQCEGGEKPNCRTSTETRSRGMKNASCIFPFKFRGKTYNTCTFYLSHITQYKPWCSTKVDKNGNHVAGGGNWGICDDHVNCPIPPRDCGVPVRTRPLPSSRDDDVDIEQLPWMASLGRYENFDIWNHQCGGSLITSKHVLTAAHCFNNLRLDDEHFHLSGYLMRLGSSDLGSNATAGMQRIVAEVFVHPKYLENRAYFDVGIAMADVNIEFNECVRPVCLPFLPVDNEDDLADNFVTLAGWGYFIDPRNELKLSSKLKLVSLQVNPKDICQEIFSLGNTAKQGLPPFMVRQQLPYGFQKHIACVGNDFDREQGACSGDSGSPVIRRVSGTAKLTPYYEQQFIVTTGIDCRLKATIFVRIADRQILTWIQMMTETAPLLLVYGGYGQQHNSSTLADGLLNDVEILCTTTNDTCSRHVRPIFGRAYLIDGHVENEAQAVGSTGVYTKGAAIVCGGKNGEENLNRCYEFNSRINKWQQIPSMRHKRYQADSVLDEDGNMWVLGGTHNSKASDTTEVYVYKPPPRYGTWRKGRPMPSALRDTGLSSHCAVRINKTHVVIAGGFAFTVNTTDPILKLGKVVVADEYQFDIHQLASPRRGGDNGRRRRHKRSRTTPVIGGGVNLNKAWMFDGFYWAEIADMSIKRDRPACSLVELPDGQIRILVAGGCEGWCVETPAIKSAEIYNPETNVWTRVADLPVPLSSAKMELLAGLPTIVGGFDNAKRNGLLYQYLPDRDEWRQHPMARLRVPRTSAAVFQVPRDMFKHC